MILGYNFKYSFNMRVRCILRVRCFEWWAVNISVLYIIYIKLMYIM